MLQFLAISTPFFAVIALGALVSGRGLFGPEAVKVLNTFAFTIAIPPVVVRVLARQPLAELWNWTYFLALALIALVMLLLGLAVGRRCFGLAHGTAVSRAQCLIGGNFAFLGIPLMLAFLGDRAAAPIAIGLICDTALVVPLSIGLIEAGRGSGSVAAIIIRLVKGTVLNPFMLSVAAGLTISLSGWSIPEPVDRFLVFLGGAAAPVGVFALGLAARQWTGQNTAQAERPRIGVIAPLVLGKLILHPLLAYGLLALVLRLEPFWVTAGVLYAALPIASNVFVIAERFQTGSRPIAVAVVAATALASLTFPLTMWLVAG
jgi:predicted permease